MLRPHRPRIDRRPRLLALAALAAAMSAPAGAHAAPAGGPASTAATPATSRTLAPQPRIVGGTAASISSVPWQVSVWSRGGDGGFDCGGAILDEYTVVTAAHCVEDVAIGDDPYDGGLGVLAGVSHLDVPRPGDDVQESVVIDARVHPQWSPAIVQTAGDLAVLELDEPLDLSGPAARAVALPPDAPIGEEPVLVGQDVLVSGYGRQIATAQPTGALFSLASRVDTPTVCPGDDNAAALCVRSPAGAACSGDSGGPLVTQTTPPILVGIVSNGPIGCPAAEGESYVNLLAPENRRFLAGDPTPPIAPRVLGDITFSAIGGLVAIGQPVVCRASFTGAATTKWKIQNDNNTTVATGVGGSEFSYRPTEADSGQLLRCTATAANEGGVAMAGPLETSGPVLRPLGRIDAPRPPVVTPFRLKEAVMTASAPKSIKRGKVIKVNVALSNLFAAADGSTVCVKLGDAKPKCLAPSLKSLQNTTVAFRFRISKRARAKSLLTFSVTAVLAGRNPNSGIVEQINRSTKLRARVTR